MKLSQNDKSYTIRVSVVTGTLRRRYGDFGAFNGEHLNLVSEILAERGWQKTPRGADTHRPELRPWQLEVGKTVYSALLVEIRLQRDISELPKNPD